MLFISKINKKSFQLLKAIQHLLYIFYGQNVCEMKRNQKF